MTELPSQFDRHRDTWITTPAGAVCVRPQAGNRWIVTARNRGQHFVSGFDLRGLVNEIVHEMGGVIRWNLGEGLAEGEVTRARLNAIYNKLYAQTDALFKQHNPCGIHKTKAGKMACNSGPFCCQGCAHRSSKGCTADKPLTCKGWRCPSAHRVPLPDADERRLRALRGRAKRLGFFKYRGTKRQSVSQAFRYLSQPPGERGPVPEGTAKTFLRSTNLPEIEWLPNVQVTRGPATGRAEQWVWAARRPALILGLENMGAGNYSAWFRREGEAKEQSLLLDDNYVWPAITVTHAENIAKDLLAGALLRRESADRIVSMLLESPQFSTLKKHKVKLTPEEREQAMKAGAVWHNGSGGEPSCAIWKAVVNGKTWYGCNTHRTVQVKATLKGAIRAFDFVKTTA
jgi:hypothetical protein